MVYRKDARDLWCSFGEAAIFVVPEGSMWLIPQGALHSLNNIGQSTTKLIVGFSNDVSENTDLSVALNGTPLPIRDAYTSPHSSLRNYVGSIHNNYFSPFNPLEHYRNLSSPYRADFDAITPLFKDDTMGSVIWAIKSNWPILEKISIWYPDVGTLYVVTRGVARFTLVIAAQEPMIFDIQTNDMVYVPVGQLHTFINNGQELFEAIAYFTKANPLAEVSLGTALNFFPSGILRDTLGGNYLDTLREFKTLPHLLRA